MNLVDFWQAPIRRILGAKDLPEKDEHRSAAFLAKAHRLLKGREKPVGPVGEALVTKLQVARIAVDNARRKAARLQTWANTAQSEYVQAQARGDDILRELFRVEGGNGLG